MKLKSISIITTFAIIFAFTPFLSNAQYLSGGYQHGAHGSGGDEILVGINEQLENTAEIVKIYPNPFRNVTNVELNIVETSIVNIDVFDLNNKIVCKIITNEKMNKGDHLFHWEGTSNAGHKLHAGVYYYKISIDNKVISRKIVMLK